MQVYLCLPGVVVLSLDGGLGTSRLGVAGVIGGTGAPFTLRGLRPARGGFCT